MLGIEFTIEVTHLLDNLLNFFLLLYCSGGGRKNRAHVLQHL